MLISDAHLGRVCSRQHFKNSDSISMTVVQIDDNGAHHLLLVFYHVESIRLMTCHGVMGRVLTSARARIAVASRWIGIVRAKQVNGIYHTTISVDLASLPPHTDAACNPVSSRGERQKLRIIAMALKTKKAMMLRKGMEMETHIMMEMGR